MGRIEDKRDTERVQILGELRGEVTVFQPMAIKEISRGGAQVETGFPWSGGMTVRIEEAPGGRWRLGLRVPAWADGATLSYGGERRPVRPGMVTVEEAFPPGAEIHLDLPLQARWTHPDPRIDAVRGCVALERGPRVYCAESAGQDAEPGSDLGTLAVDTATEPAEGTTEGLGDAVTLTGSARALPVGDGAWPYGARPPAPVDGARPLTFVPYHLWGNRGPATMRVWLPAG